MKKILVILLMSLLLISCKALTSEEVTFEEYEGEALNFAVVGEIPLVREENVTFTKITLEGLLTSDISTYDGIFITKENQEKASDEQYKDLFISGQCFILIDPEKHFMEFTEMELGYIRAKDASTYGYMTVFQRISEKEMRFNELDLYNDEISDGHIEACYSVLFDLISDRRNES